MNQLFLDIQKRLEKQITELEYTAVWNNQFAYMNRDSEVEESFPMPCCFIEFVNNNNPKSIGNGVQIYEPLTIRLRIGMEEIDARDGTENQNLNIFYLKDKFYSALQGWLTEGSGTFDRTAEAQDYDHNNVYVWVMEFTTSYIDTIAQKPRNAIRKDPPTTLETEIEIVQETNKI